MLAVLAIVTAGAVLAALPLGIGWLLTGRALQGVGLGLTPVAMAVARSALQGSRGASTAAALSITTVAGVGLGYPLAGLVAEVGGVHAAFRVGAVVSASAAAVAFLALPRPPCASRSRLDVVGALLLGSGLTGALVALGEGVDVGWTSAPVLDLVIRAVLLLPACCWCPSRWPASSAAG